MSSDNLRPGPALRFDRRSPSEWIAQAMRYERMAEQLSAKPELSRQFLELASHAREMAKQSGAFYPGDPMDGSGNANLDN